MRLIDADALTVGLRLAAKRMAASDSEWLKGYADGLDAASNAVAEAPTIDAVPVVRCKDCKHGKTWKNAWGIEGFKCDLLCVDLSPEAFCSYGERKDGANDG